MCGGAVIPNDDDKPPVPAAVRRAALRRHAGQLRPELWDAKKKKKKRGDDEIQWEAAFLEFVVAGDDDDDGVAMFPPSCAATAEAAVAPAVERPRRRRVRRSYPYRGEGKDQLPARRRSSAGAGQRSPWDVDDDDGDALSRRHATLLPAQRRCRGRRKKPGVGGAVRDVDGVVVGVLRRAYTTGVLLGRRDGQPPRRLRRGQQHGHLEHEQHNPLPELRS
uniref:Uncharacterized protein n=1 Tax=Oryza brachyantha TaxID=4533 RepID=J3MW71_ORYBR